MNGQGTFETGNWTIEGFRHIWEGVVVCGGPPRDEHFGIDTRRHFGPGGFLL